MPHRSGQFLPFFVGFHPSLAARTIEAGVRPGCDSHGASFVVVEAQKALEGSIELPESGEVAAAKLDAPVLVQDGLLEPLDEAVGEGVSRLGSGVTNAEGSAGFLEAL